MINKYLVGFLIVLPVLSIFFLMHDVSRLQAGVETFVVDDFNKYLNPEQFWNTDNFIIGYSLMINTSRFCNTKLFCIPFYFSLIAIPIFSIVSAPKFSRLPSNKCLLTLLMCPLVWTIFYFPSKEFFILLAALFLLASFARNSLPYLLTSFLILFFARYQLAIALLCFTLLCLFLPSFIGPRLVLFIFIVVLAYSANISTSVSDVARENFVQNSGFALTSYSLLSSNLYNPILFILLTPIIFSLRLAVLIISPLIGLVHGLNIMTYSGVLVLTGIWAIPLIYKIITVNPSFAVNRFLSIFTNHQLPKLESSRILKRLLLIPWAISTVPLSLPFLDQRYFYSSLLLAIPFIVYQPLTGYELNPINPAHSRNS
jgi:hypothetical protein